MGSRINKLASILVDYSVNIQPGDRVVVEASTAAESLVRSIYRRILERGGHPHLLLSLPDQEEIFYSLANEDQLDFVPTYEKLAADEFDARIRIYSQTNTRALTGVDPLRQARRQKATAAVQQVIMKRGAEGSLRWVSTQYPTEAYAMEADMGLNAYQDFFFKACHADEGTPDPIGYWKNIQLEQLKVIARIEGHDLVTLRGPDVDLSLSIKGRRFNNSCGIHNLPDGEIYTGPVETSLNGWVRTTYPAVFAGRVVDGIELTFEQGRVVKASATKEEALLLSMLDTDAGARYVGEFAIGANFQIDRFTKNILFDEKIGGTFHMALGMGYPETGSLNHSVIHWDMICDLRTDSEIRVDGELFYKDGKFTR